MPKIQHPEPGAAAYIVVPERMGNYLSTASWWAEKQSCRYPDFRMGMRNRIFRITTLWKMHVCDNSNWLHSPPHSPPTLGVGPGRRSMNSWRLAHHSNWTCGISCISFGDACYEHNLEDHKSRSHKLQLAHIVSCTTILSMPTSATSDCGVPSGTPQPKHRAT